MSTSFANITKVPELQKRIVFTLALLAVYRVGVFITVPFVNRAKMSQIMAGGSEPTGGFLNLFNLFSGGALEQLSIFALGIMPYISASIIFQLLGVVVPTLERMQKEGEQGRRKITQYTRYATVGLSIVQSFGISFYLETLNDSNAGLVTMPGWGFRLMTVLTLTTGTAFIMWLGEQITERGIGNGISLIIMAGIIAYLPQAMIETYQLFDQGQLTTLSVMLILVVVLGVIAFIVFFERAQRRIPVQYAKRMVGRQRIAGGQSSYLPLKVNTAGVIPPIFAMSILLFPSTIVGYFPEEAWALAVRNALVPGDWRYNLLYVLLNVFFCYFYTAVTFNPVDVADNMKKVGGFVPGIRPGKKTAEYIDKVLTRITFAGAAYVSAVCVLPFFLVDYLGVTFYFGGTGLLIIVGVALDTVNQIESHLVTRHYEGFTGGDDDGGGGGGRRSIRRRLAAG